MKCRLASLIDQKNISNAELGDGTRLNQSSLSKTTGIATSTINRLYKNTFTRVDIGTIEMLCDFFECDISDLFVLKDEDSNVDEEEEQR